MARVLAQRINLRWRRFLRYMASCMHNNACEENVQLGSSALIKLWDIEFSLYELQSNVAVCGAMLKIA